MFFRSRHRRDKKFPPKPSSHLTAPSASSSFFPSSPGQGRAYDQNPWKPVQRAGPEYLAARYFFLEKRLGNRKQDFVNYTGAAAMA